MNISRFVRLLFVLTLVVAAGCAAAQNGRFVFVDGDVRIARKDSQSIPVRIGDSIEPGSTISTGIGRAHLKFPDQTALSMQPGTVFRIDEYNYQGKEDGSERFFASLVKGALRAVTGAIGKRNSARFGINGGVVATVGIRGTAFKMELCSGDCAGKSDGLYVDGGEGITVVRNGFGEILLRSGESAFVQNSQNSPQRSAVRTSVAAPSPKSPATLVGAVREEQKFSDYVFKTGGLEPPFTAIQVTRGGAALAGVDSDGRGGIAAGSGQLSAQQLAANKIVAIVDGGNRVFAFAAADGNGSGFALSSNVENAGTDGSLYWGRWANGQVQVGATGTNGSGFATIDLSGARTIHYIVTSTTALIPAGGTASYTYFAGTPSTSADGAIGSGVTSGTLNVNFGSNSGSLALSILHAGAVLNQNGTFTLNAGNRAAFTGTGAGSHAWRFDGFFGGGNQITGAPARAGASYEIQRPGNFIYGVAGFK